MAEFILSPALSTSTAMMSRKTDYIVRAYRTGFDNDSRYWVGVMEVAFLKAL